MYANIVWYEYKYSYLQNLENFSLVFFLKKNNHYINYLLLNISISSA